MTLKFMRQSYLQKLSKFIFVLLLSFAHCTDKKPTEPVQEEQFSFISDKITIGEITKEHSEDIGPTGGIVTVTNPQSSINGFTIEIPQNGYQETRNFSISTANVSSHKLGDNFNPISPLIIIQNGGGYSNYPMTVTLPIEKSTDEFLFCWFYDETTGEVEILPPLMQDESSITIETRHFALSSISSGTELDKSGNRGVIGNLIISSIKESILSGQNVISSGFTPGIDDWEFINYGSYIAPNGHCAGQSMTAMWYYYEKRLNGAPPLFHLYDTFNEANKPKKLWQDNPLGYRFASTIQEDFNWDGWIELVNLEARHPKLTWHTFIAAMLITGEPQFVIIKTSDDKSGHAMIAYKINLTEGKMYIADPNYPNNRGTDGAQSIRTISYVNGKINPYPSFQKAGDPGTVYDQVAIFGKTANIDWSQITKRYKELEDESIGNDRFPKYDLTVKKDGGDVPLVDDMTVTKDTLEFYCRNDNIPGFLPGTNRLQKIYIYSEQGDFLTSANNSNGLTKLKLNAGKNKFGIWVCGYKNNVAYEYYDFKWYTINYEEPPPGDVEILQSNRCVVKVHFNGHYQQINQDNETTEFDQEDYWGQFAAIGSFSGKSFVGNYNETLGSSNYAGSVVVNLNEDNSMITSVDWTEDYTSYWQNNVDATSTSSFGGSDIPKSALYPGVYQINGEQTCNHLSIVQYDYQNMTTLIHQTLESHICNQYSYITISFSKE